MLLAERDGSRGLMSSLAMQALAAMEISASEINIANDEENLSRLLSEVSQIVSRVYYRVCVRAAFGDKRTLLQWNRLWNKDL